MTREERYKGYDERIDRYLRGLMSDSERSDFEQDVDKDPELRERLVATSLLVQGIAQEGMRREGRAQLDAIKQMSQKEFIDASLGRKGRKSVLPFMRWASGIAAVAIIAFCIYTYNSSSSLQQPEMVQVVEEEPQVMVADKPVEPTLASLADEYNEPFDGEPDQFVEIRKQIKKGNIKIMMEVVDNIDKIEWPTAKHGPKGADDSDGTKETLSNYEDCTHWYKALAYLKANDKPTAVLELQELMDNGQNEDLLMRASSLLKKLKK